MKKEKEGGDDKDLIVRCRGLPWSCTENEIRKFLGEEAEIDQVSFTFNREGRPNGECYVVFSNEESFTKALNRDREKIGHRYVEMYVAKKDEMDHVLKVRGQPPDTSNSSCVRLRGLPFGTQKDSITEFFKDLTIKEGGIFMPSKNGRTTGEAFVEFADPADAEEAMKKHMSHLGERYIEVFRSSKDELREIKRKSSLLNQHFDDIFDSPLRGGWGPGGGGGFGRRPGPYDRPGGPRGPRSPWSGGGPSWGGGGPFGGPRAGPFGAGGWNGGGGPHGWGGGPSGGAWDQGGGPYGWGGNGGGPGGPGGGASLRGAGGKSPVNSSTGNMHLAGTTVIKCRGLPYSAHADDIIKFFDPLQVAGVELLREWKTGRPSGEARVAFYTSQDANTAMKKDKQNMGQRYIELFLENGGDDDAGASTGAGGGTAGAASYAGMYGWGWGWGNA